jgi:hypothetical protein
MNRDVIAALRDRADSIRQRWEALLRVEPVLSPLAHPDTLAFLIPASVEQMLAWLNNEPAQFSHLNPTLRSRRTPCLCGDNPYVPYYKAGEQALLESLILVQAELQTLTTRDADLAEFHGVFRALADRDIEAFCEACNSRDQIRPCRLRDEEEGRQPVDGEV